MSAIIIVLSVMTIPSLVGDRPGSRCPTPQSVEVPTEQEGAVFTWTIPRDPSQESSSPELPTPPHPLELSGNYVECTFISHEFR